MAQLLEWHAGVEPTSQARSRRTVQVAQHAHRLARLRIHPKNRVEVANRSKGYMREQFEMVSNVRRRVPKTPFIAL